MPDSLSIRIQNVLEQNAVPGMGNVTLANVTDYVVDGDAVTLTVKLGYPCQSRVQDIGAQIRAIMSEAGLPVTVQVEQTIAGSAAINAQNKIAGVKNIIAVSSGKGGVGKSTTAVNIALALAHEGANVGVLDADIYGPSQSQMLGVNEVRPEMASPNMMKPIETFGLKLISMGNLVTENTPMVWRGPMVSGALKQLLQNTHWEDIDYLIVDMPPGTGDIQLTLSQSVPVSGALVVTTPQDIALLDAKKGIEMFRKVNVPVLGVVENMATHICSNCGHQEAIFGQHGGDRLAKEYAVALLGRLPLKLDICQLTDSGKPPVASDPESTVSKIYRDIARNMAAALWQKSMAQQSAPHIAFVDE